MGAEIGAISLARAISARPAVMAQAQSLAAEASVPLGRAAGPVFKPGLVEPVTQIAMA